MQVRNERTGYDDMGRFSELVPGALSLHDWWGHTELGSDHINVGGGRVGAYGVRLDTIQDDGQPAGVINVRNLWDGQNDTGRMTTILPGRLDVANWWTSTVIWPGKISTPVIEIRGGDLAEPFAVAKSADQSEKIEPGKVAVIDPDHVGRLKLATRPYDRTVAGVISGANGLSPGVIMKSEDAQAKDAHPVAMTGRVWCWCDASYGTITPGDRLTTSATAGHAMKVTDRDRADGAVIGKAMSKLEKGKGLVLVLVQPQ